MSNQPQNSFVAPRTITAEEVANFRRNGWARLNGLITPGTAAAILARLQARMGSDAKGQVDGG